MIGKLFDSCVPLLKRVTFISDQKSNLTVNVFICYV